MIILVIRMMVGQDYHPNDVFVKFIKLHNDIFLQCAEIHEKPRVLSIRSTGKLKHDEQKIPPSPPDIREAEDLFSNARRREGSFVVPPEELQRPKLQRAACGDVRREHPPSAVRSAG